MMTLREATQIIAHEKKAYYRQWVFDQPLLFSDSQLRELQSFQALYSKVIHHFVENYDKFKALMPVSEKLERVLQAQAKQDYHIGTYRTDFVYDDNNDIKLIEITCRFALNGVFLAAIMDLIAKETVDQQSTQNQLDVYSGIFTHLEAKRNQCSNIIIVVGDDRRNESKLYCEIYEKMGLNVDFVNYKHLNVNYTNSADTWFILELALEEIEALPVDTVDYLCRQNTINDFRTIILLHDKRFFSLLNNHTFLSSVLSQSELKKLQSYLTPTYSYLNLSKEQLANIRANKTDWVIKHRSLGKSQSVFAGVVTDQQEWENLFLDESLLENMVFQKWVPQTTFEGTVQGKPHNDYLTGTLLFFDDYFFGFGDFRTSSFPVTNKVDHRKMGSLFLSTCI